MTPIDLRSDTVTCPDDGMRAAMAHAVVGDDVYGEDPTVRQLEERVALLLGKEAAVFVPSGTMANQLAIGIAVVPGDEVIAEQGSHTVNFEGGAISALWGAQPRTLPGVRGVFTVEQLAAALRPDNSHFPRSRLVTLENTSNRGGGAVWPLERMREIASFARSKGLTVHLDGARLFNAQAATGVKVAEYAAQADTVAVCLSKGLGAPVGSLLAGGKGDLEKARRLRKRLGGGMRQAGILAAAGLYALEHNVERLADDHANARLFAEGLAALPRMAVDLKSVETNMVFAEVKERDAAWSVLAFRAAGVLCNAEGSTPGLLRFVTHLHVSRQDASEAAARIGRALS